MKTNSLGHTLFESLNNAESWIRQAEQQFLVAEAISTQIRVRGLSECENLLRVGYLKTTALLLALCVENALKSIKASRTQLQVDNHGLTKETRGGGPSGHSLLKLADEVELILSENQIVLLEKLAQIGIWAGKYHSPIRHQQFEVANAKDPRTITLPDDIDVVKKLLLDAARIAGVPTAIQ